MSLIELIVAVAIMSVVMTGAFQVFTEGLRLFRTNQAAADAQSSAIKTLSRITNELVNANPEMVRTYSSATGNLDGVVFTSPLAENGSAQFDPVSGKIYWQKYICYYHQPNPDTPALGKLIRKEAKIPDEAGAGTGFTGSTNTASVRSGLSGLSTDAFAADESLPSRALGTAVSGFQVKTFEGTVDDGGGTRDILGGATVTDRKRSIDVRLEAGDAEDRGPDGYYIRVDSRVTPRG